jgi:DNA-binding Xre family transcriptional regulator
VLTEHDITAYEVAKRSGGKVIPSTLYRLVRQRGRVRMFDGVLLETLCQILNVEPGALLERGGRKGR